MGPNQIWSDSPALASQVLGLTVSATKQKLLFVSPIDSGFWQLGICFLTPWTCLCWTVHRWNPIACFHWCLFWLNTELFSFIPALAHARTSFLSVTELHPMEWISMFMIGLDSHLLQNFWILFPLLYKEWFCNTVQIMMWVFLKRYSLEYMTGSGRVSPG